MNTLDIIISAIVLLGLWRGFTKGFIKSFISLVGWLIALIAASRFASVAAPLFTDVVASPQLQIAMGFLAIVLVVLTILMLVSSIANKLMETLKIKILDRVAGGILGAFKGVLIVLIAISAASPLMQRMPFWQNSLLVPELMPYAPVAMQLSKEVLKRSVQEITLADANETATDATQPTETDQHEGGQEHHHASEGDIQNQPDRMAQP